MQERFIHRTKGFAAFRAGTFGNAGHNLYVSRAGVLQRIHQFDLNRDGYFDLVFCNSQEHWESPPACVYLNPLGSESGWRGETPPGTWVRAQMRFARSRAQLDAAEWHDAGPGRGWLSAEGALTARRNAGGWAQYRLALGAKFSLSTPRVTEVSVECAPSSQRTAPVNSQPSQDMGRTQ